MNFLDAIAPLGSMPFVNDHDMPLTSSDGSPLLCRRVGNVLVFHPLRLAELRSALANPQPSRTDLARWADDGGRAP